MGECKVSEREIAVLNNLVRKYVAIELSNNRNLQWKKFFTVCQNIFFMEIAKKEINSADYVEMKTLHDVRKRFFEACDREELGYRGEREKFHVYFYNKFLDEIKVERQRVTGNKYSRKQSY